MLENPIITLTTDFGNREYYVGAVRGSILSVHPEARLVDISHEVASHDILEGAFTLRCAYESFPPHTIHLVVVDPGVGSARRGIIALSENHRFVAPDNGVLSLAFDREEISRVVSIESDHYFRRPVSPTFQARDIFGPVVGRLARGIAPDKFGPEIEDQVRLKLPPLQRVSEKDFEGVVLHVDKFGNVITNLSAAQVSSLLGSLPEAPVFTVNERRISRHCRFYAEGENEEVFSLLGSSGYYELASARKPAARILEARRGARVRMQVA